MIDSRFWWLFKNHFNESKFNRILKAEIAFSLKILCHHHWLKTEKKLTLLFCDGVLKTIKKKRELMEFYFIEILQKPLFSMKFVKSY